MDALGLGSILIAALCLRGLACGGMGVLFAIGLIGILTTRKTNHTPWRKSKRWGSFALVLIGAVGLIYSAGIPLANILEAQNSSQCLEIAVTNDYKITSTAAYDEVRLYSTSGSMVDFPAIYSYALAEHYLIGRTADPEGGYFWFDLMTRVSQRFTYAQRAAFVKSVKDLGFSEVPMYLTIEEHCKAGSCQPCTLKVN